MGVNLVPIVRNFSIHNENFPADSHDIEDGCVTAGNHRVMRFDFLTHNKGDTDLNVGNPSDHPDWYVESASHGHYHLIDFNEFMLYDSDGNPWGTGAKQAFCLIDIEKIDPSAGAAQFNDCNSNQGVTAGWADLYDKFLPCQYVVIDGLADGDYTLMSTTNAQRIVGEDTFDDNTICTGLRIQGNNVTEIDPPIAIEVPNTNVTFNDIPEGEETVRAIVFELKTCRSVTVKYDNDPSDPQFVKHGELMPAAPETNSMDVRYLRLWLRFKALAANTTASATVQVSCVETGDSWMINISANTITRPTVGVVMVLDQSGSMLEDSGLSSMGLPTRNDVLKFAAPPFVDLLQENNGIGIVDFDHEAYDRMAVTKAGAPSPIENTRVTAKGFITAHSPNEDGMTSIGDGVEHAHDLLQPVTDYDQKAMVVLTDGHENSSKYIEDVAAYINDRVFAIGLGTVDQLNPVALQSLVNGTDGYLLLTGILQQDNLFLLTKYYLQILAGVTNLDIVVDPEGYLPPGVERRIPFILNEADITVDVILLTAAPPNIFAFTLETPAGDRIDPAVAAATPAIVFVPGTNVCFYRMTLPVPVGAAGAGPGKWHVVLSVDKAMFKRYVSTLEKDPELQQSVAAHGIKYSVSVHSLSNLRMTARLVQQSNIPGAEISIRAVLTEYGVPLPTRATVRAEITRPDSTTTTMALAKIEPGVYQSSFTATLSGIYPIHVTANGVTSRSKPFSREQLLTGAVWKGGDNPPPTSGTDPHTRDEQICRLLECLFGREGVDKALAKLGVRPDAVRDCLRRLCHERTDRPREAPRRKSRPPVTGERTAPVARRSSSKTRRGASQRKSSS